MTPGTTLGERKVIRWFSGVFFAVAIAYVAFAWISRERECNAACSVAGLGDGRLIFTGRNRLELGSRCECAPAAEAAAAD